MRRRRRRGAVSRSGEGGRRARRRIVVVAREGNAGVDDARCWRLGARRRAVDASRRHEKRRARPRRTRRRRMRRDGAIDRSCGPARRARRRRIEALASAWATRQSAPPRRSRHAFASRRPAPTAPGPAGREGRVSCAIAAIARVNLSINQRRISAHFQINPRPRRLSEVKKSVKRHLCHRRGDSA